MNSADIKYGVFDDDLKFIRRTPNGEKSKRLMNASRLGLYVVRN